VRIASVECPKFCVREAAVLVATHKGGCIGIGWRAARSRICPTHCPDGARTRSAFELLSYRTGSAPLLGDCVGQILDALHAPIPMHPPL